MITLLVDIGKCVEFHYLNRFCISINEKMDVRLIQTTSGLKTAASETVITTTAPLRDTKEQE